MKALLIAEKPDLMRKVQAAYKNRGFKDYIFFMSFHGHVMQLYQPDDYKEEWKTWSLDTIPLIPEKFKYKAADKDTVNKIKEEIKNGGYDYLINCCDPDREGQHIFYSFYETIGCKLPVKRMWHADLTEDELIRALNNMEDDLHTPRLANMKEASKLRAQMDWEVGMNASRILSIKRHSLTRIGRVMTPTFKILADREEAIRNFVPKTTYGIEADFREGYRGELYTKNDDGNTVARYDKKDDAENKLKDINGKGKILNIEENEVKEKAPQLPSIADLQMSANKMYGFTLNKTLSLVQSLYEKKIVSYPRTDCCYITSAIAKDFSKILSTLSGHADFNNYIKDISQSRLQEIANDKRYVNDKKVTAHYAIIPTGFDFEDKLLTADEKTIFELIAKRFIAIFLAPYRTLKTKIETDVKNNLFVTHGTKILDLGYKCLYKDDDNNEDNSIKANLRIGDTVDVDKAEIVEHVSKPLPRYTDATLLSAMINAGNLIEDKELANVLKGDKKVKDSGGIGTPATRAAIVEKIISPINTKTSSYYLAKRKGKTFEVTDEGLSLAKDIADYEISSPELTAIWEQKLREVEDGKLSVDKFHEDMIDFTKKMSDELMKAKYHEVAAANSQAEFLDARCPICGGRIKQTAKYYLCENYSKDGGCKFVIGRNFLGANLAEKDVVALCNGKNTKELKMKSTKTNKEFKASLMFDKNTQKIAFVFNSPSAKETSYKCPVCGGELKERDGKNGKYLSCDNKDFFMSLKIAGHKLTKGDIGKLLKGETVGPYEDFVAKSGKNFKAKLKLEGKDIKFEF